MSRRTNRQLMAAVLILLCGLGWAAAGENVWAADLAFSRPLNGQIITRFKVPYYEVVSGKKRTHHGVDILSAEGTRVTAAADGRVSFTGQTPIGYCVSIKHDNGVKTTYLPLRDMRVSRGDRVQRGQTIGYVAAGGDASAVPCHLHTGALFAGHYIDPESLWRGEFRTDFSKLIRRGDIPPESVSLGDGWRPAAGQTVIGGFISGCLDIGAGFIGGALGAGEDAWGWLLSLGRSTTGYFDRPTGVVFGRRWRRLAERAGLRQLMVGGLGPGSAVGGVYQFDPTGDAAYPADRISLGVRADRQPREVEVFDDSGVRVRVLAGWESPPGSITWTGEDDAGRIVPAGLYTVIAKRADGSATALLAEVRWHSW